MTDTANHRGRYGRYIHNIITFGDFVVLNVSFVIAFLMLGRFTAWPLREILMAANVAYVPVALLTSGVHKWRSNYMERVVRNAILAVIAHVVFFILLIFCLGITYIDPRFFLVFYSSLMVLLITWWLVCHRIVKSLRRHGRNFSRVIIVGTGPTAKALYKQMHSDAGFGYKLMGFFSNHPEDGLPDDIYVGSIDEIGTFIADYNIDEVYYTLSDENTDTLSKVIDETESRVAKFYYVPQINRYMDRGFKINKLGSISVLSLSSQPLESLWNRFMKRTFDIIFSTGVLVVLGPLVFLPVSIAIKMSSPGPVFFRQKRTGYRGRDFMCYKFRTMRVNNDADTRQATADDPRKTRVGDLLRRTSIDELPQFVNVLLGDMSVVGPRPHMLKHTKEYSRLIERYMVRHYIKPGITGWAQVCGLRGQTDELWKMEKRVEHDVWYINNWTFLLDIKIIYKTVTNAIRGEKNAF